MYERFGAVIDDTGVEFRLFFPNRTHYIRGGLPGIRSVRVAGDFQRILGGSDWSSADAPLMIRTEQSEGTLFSYRVRGDLPDGFYQYKYFAEFDDGSTRWCADPCTRYGGAENGNAAFVVGGRDVDVDSIPEPVATGDLVIYEMHVGDFTDRIRGEDAPLDAVRRKLDYLAGLGVNAIEFMPLTARTGNHYSWGYDPSLPFSVEYTYVNDSRNPLDKICRLKRLISEMHHRGMMAIFDGVFNHVATGRSPEYGFPYFWLYRDPADSPFVGRFGEGFLFSDLDYHNACTREFVTDICQYWFDEFRIDGIRFDHSRGYLDPGNLDTGVARLCADLAARRRAAGMKSPVPLILEHLTDNRFQAIDQINRCPGVTGCWFDPLMHELRDAAKRGAVGPEIMRALDTRRDFAEGKWPVIYCENHDHASLVNRVGGRDVWWKVQPGIITLFTLPGAVLFFQGAEMANDLALPEWGEERIGPRPLDWKQCSDLAGTRLTWLYRKLIALRKMHPVLRSGNFSVPRVGSPEHDGSGALPSMAVIIYYRGGEIDGGGTGRFVIVVNFSDCDQWIEVPFPHDGVWRDVLNDRDDRITGRILRDQRILPHWGRIYQSES